MKDITERKRLLAEVEQARQQQLQMKSQFLSCVSHELRSPLTAIYQFVTILLDGLAGDLSLEQREYLEIMLRNANQLRTMVDDLLEVTRAETGRLTIDPRCVSLIELIPEVVGNVTAATTKGVFLSADVPDDLPLAHADPDRVQQILINLIDNGIRFTPEKGTVTVRAQVSNEDPDFVCVAVADTGCGISPEETGKIFEYLHRVESNVEDNRKGLGLGLHICKELIHGHGGRIWVESQPGCGSTFFFTLPIFSLARLLNPILTPRNLLRGSIALITVELFPIQKRPLTKADETAVQQAWDIVQGCILPNLGVVLPKMPRTKLGEIFFAVACVDRSGAERVVRQIRQHLARCEGLHSAALDPMVSFTMLDIPSNTDNGPSEQLVKDVAGSIEDLVGKACYGRRHLYG